jgi:uncharacterized membrane protein (UPF0127 family)
MAFPPHHRGKRLLVRIAVFVLAAWLIATLSRQAFGQPGARQTDAASALPSGPQSVELRIEGKRLSAELADTPELRSRGLMYRTDLARDQGMLFVFDQADRHCMWMRNTPLPLSVAFIDASGRITNIANMQPFSDTAHCAIRPVLFALETRQGWFTEHQLGPGHRVHGIPGRR